MGAVVEKIDSLEAEFQLLSDDTLRAKTAEFKTRLSAGRIAARSAPRIIRGCARGQQTDASACAILIFN